MKKKRKKRKSQPCNLAAYHALFMTDSREYDQKIQQQLIAGT